MIGQGLVLLVVGMGIVYAFLYVLILVTNITCKPLAKFNNLIPQEGPKKAPANKAAAGGDANVALAIAVALKG